MQTPYHAAYNAHELTRRRASDSLEKLGASMLTATVDLNPHQLDAALFAFRSPLSRGAILADEVGLDDYSLQVAALPVENKADLSEDATLPKRGRKPVPGELPLFGAGDAE